MKTSRLKMFLAGVIACLSITTAWADIPIDAAHFPDEGFRKWMSVTTFGEDGIITDAEIDGIDHLEVVNGDDWTVKSVKGIKYFPKLTSLYMVWTIDNVDLTECPQLEVLLVGWWGECQMTSIDLSPVPNLKKFTCVGSHIKSLDLRNNPLITDLFVWDCPDLETMDISNCKKLYDLRCDGTLLSSIDVSNCKDLYLFNCFGCPNLTSINVTGCTDLCYFSCYDTPVASIDVSTCEKLAEYHCHRTNMTRLDLYHNGGITVLACTGGKLQEIILPNSLVHTIDCHDNPQLTTLNISGSSHLRTINFSNTQVANVDLSACQELGLLVGWGTPLSELDLTNCPDIGEIDCADTKLTSLNLSGCLQLDRVKVDNCQLTTLKMPASGCKIATLDCKDNKLSELDLRGCGQLMTLECQNNQLTSLLLNPIIYPDDYPDFRYELGTLCVYNNKLRDTAVDALINKLLPREYETDLWFYDAISGKEGNYMTPEQVAAAKAKNWSPLYQNYVDPSNPQPEQITWYSYEGGNISSIQLQKADQHDGIYHTIEGIRLQGQPTQKGLYIRNNKKILVK